MDYDYCAICGALVQGATDWKTARCSRHIGKEPPRKKQKDYSGDSKYRVKMGQFQSKDGR